MVWYVKSVCRGIKALRTLDFVIILGGRFLIFNIILIYEISIY